MMLAHIFLVDSRSMFGYRSVMWMRDLKASSMTPGRFVVRNRLPEQYSSCGKKTTHMSAFDPEVPEVHRGWLPTRYQCVTLHVLPIPLHEKHVCLVEQQDASPSVRSLGVNPKVAFDFLGLKADVPASKRIQ